MSPLTESPWSTPKPKQKFSAYEAIYAVVNHIPRGRVATYGQIAKLVNLGGGARQVGYALSALPADTRVPWHRVINANGAISTRKDPQGECRQRQLLEREGIVFDAQQRIPFARFVWTPRQRAAQSWLTKNDLKPS